MISFTEDECLQIIKLSKSLNRTRRDDTPRPISYTYYSIGWSSEFKWIFDRLDIFFTEQTGIKVLKSLDTVHLFDYKEGDKFLRHRDIYYDNQAYNIGVCLNDTYKGGEFVLYEPTYKVLPKKTGTIYTFNHSLEHEVLEVQEGHRWSLIGFYFYEHLSIHKSIL